MDAPRSLNIARRRFKNGNYLLSLKRYAAARREFEVALSIFERAGSYRETAEALNNIGIACMKEGRPEEAKGCFERSYVLKKAHDEGGASLFNSLYNIVGLGRALTAEELETYFGEMRALGEGLGGEYAAIVAREQQAYGRYVEARAAEQKRLEVEALALEHGAALARLEELGMPCVVRVRFALYGYALSAPEIEFPGGEARLAGISPGEGVSTGEIEFEADYGSVRRYILDGDEALPEAGYRRLKMALEAVALARDDAALCIGRRSFGVRSIALRNALGEAVELRRPGGRRHGVEATLTGEDALRAGGMAVAGRRLHRMLLLRARRSLAEGEYFMGMVEAVAGFEAFLDVLLGSALPDALKKEYLAMGSPCLGDRLRFLRLLAGCPDPASPLGAFLGDAGAGLDAMLADYGRAIRSEGGDVGASEAGCGIAAVGRAVGELEARYGI